MLAIMMALKKIRPDFQVVDIKDDLSVTYSWVWFATGLR